MLNPPSKTESGAGGTPPAQTWERELPLAYSSHSAATLTLSEGTLRRFSSEIGLSIDVDEDEARERDIAECAARHQSRFAFDADEVVANFLWVGSYRSTLNPEQLRKRGIRYILNLSCTNLRQSIVKEFDCVNFSVADSAEQLMFGTWCETNRIIDNARKDGTGALVCCQRGISRSVATAAAFLLHAGMEPCWMAALTRIQTARPGAAPNYEFCRQLYVLTRANGDCVGAEERYQELADDFGQELELPSIRRLQVPLEGAADEEFLSSTESTLGSSVTSRHSTERLPLRPHEEKRLTDAVNTSLGPLAAALSQPCNPHCLIPHAAAPAPMASKVLCSSREQDEESMCSAPATAVASH